MLDVLNVVFYALVWIIIHALLQEYIWEVHAEDKIPYCTVEQEILTRRNVSPILPSGLAGENFVSRIFLSCVNDYRDCMATFTVLAKRYSIEYNTKVSGLSEIFVQ